MFKMNWLKLEYFRQRRHRRRRGQAHLQPPKRHRWQGRAHQQHPGTPTRAHPRKKRRIHQQVKNMISYTDILRCVADCCKRGTVAFTCEEIQQTAATASLPRLQIEIRNGGKTDEPQEDPRRLICCSVFFI